MEKQINLTCKRSERTIEYLSFDKPRTFVQKGYEVYNGDKPICFISKDDSLGEWNANSFYKFENCEGLCGGLTKKEVLENIERLLLEGTLYFTWAERNEVAELEVSKMKVQLIDSNYAYVITESNDRLKVALYKDEVGIYFVNEMLKKTYVIKNDELAVEDYSYFEGLENNAVAVGIDNMATKAAELWKDYKEAKEVAKLEASEKETKSHEVWKLFNELDDDGLASTNHYGEALCQKQNVQYHWDDDLSVEDIETVIEYFKTLKQLIKLERKVSKLAIYG